MSLQFVLLALTGCGIADFLGQSSVAPGLIVTPPHDTIAIILPDTVRAGEPFEVRFNTRGGSCVPETVRTRTRLVAPDTVEIQPFDRVKSWGCGDAIGIFLTHSATIHFDRPGRATVRVVGDKGYVLGDQQRSGAVITRNVIVLPTMT